MLFKTVQLDPVAALLQTLVRTLELAKTLHFASPIILMHSIVLNVPMGSFVVDQSPFKALVHGRG